MAESKPTKASDKFIHLLKKAMEEHPEKPSLRQVAVRADISASYLSLLLSGDRAAPSSDAIARLEKVLNLPKGELFTAAGKPDSATSTLFRREEAGSIMRTLAPLPDSELSEIRKLIERFVKKRKGKK